MCTPTLSNHTSGFPYSALYLSCRSTIFQSICSTVSIHFGTDSSVPVKRSGKPGIQFMILLFLCCIALDLEKTSFGSAATINCRMQHSFTNNIDFSFIVYGFSSKIAHQCNSYWRPIILSLTKTSILKCNIRFLKKAPQANALVSFDTLLP